MIAKDFFRQKRGELVLAAVLLAAMLVVLLQPTIKPTRAIEVKPGNEGIKFQTDTVIAENVRVPKSKWAYFILWIKDHEEERKITSSDYKEIKLEIKDQEGKIVRTSTKPSFIKKEDHPALLFGFNPITTDGQSRYSFVLNKAESIILEQPLAAHIKTSETSLAAFEFAEKKNWITLLVEKAYGESLDGEDISSYIRRGEQIVKGENPYSCTKNYAACEGYPAHLPGMYWVAAGFVKMGINELGEWAKVWRPIVFGTWFLIGLILLVYIMRKQQPALAVASFGFWLFNRWSVDVLRIAHTDFLGTLFLLLSVLLINRAPYFAALMLGVSLSIKQLAILVVPLFLIYLFRTQKMKLPKLFIILILIVLPPLAVTLPFLIDDPVSTMTGVMNVAERSAQTVHGFAPSLDTWFDMTNGKWAIMLFLAAAVYIAAWRKETNLAQGTFLVLAIMIAFTSTLYNQYLVWLLAFLPVVVANYRYKSIS